MKTYSVNQLAKLAGVSIRTLHLYDELGLLKPSIRTEAKYRLYGEAALFRLQQILFYKELNFPLKQIAAILDDPDFDLLSALTSHKTALKLRQTRIHTLLDTIDKTIHNLKKGGTMLDPEELYRGMPKETVTKFREQIIEKYGSGAITKSENYLHKLTKEEIKKLKVEAAEIGAILFKLRNEDPTSDTVQKEIVHHYEVIRKFWGTANSSDTQAEAYAGLGELYLGDERYTLIDGKAQPEYALFLSKAMRYFAKTKL